MEDFVFDIVKQFKLKPKFVKKLKYMYICQTEKGPKLLKPINIEQKELFFIHNFKEYIKNNEFFLTDFYYTSNGLPFTTYNETTYVLTDCLEVSELDFNNIEQVKNIIACIAKLHNLSKNFNKEVKVSTKHSKYSDITKSLMKKTENLVKLKKIIKKQKRLSDFDIEFIKNYDYFYNQCVNSIEILDKNINNLNNSYFCHNNLKEENLLFKNEIYITNFEDMSLDHYVFDISSFILRYIRKMDNSYLEINEILEIYNKYNNISKEVEPILVSLLNFPERFITTCINFYEKKRKFTPISLSNQLNDVIRLKEFHKNYISSIKF